MNYVALAVLATIMQAAPPVPRKTADNSTQTTADVKAKRAPNEAEALPTPASVKADSNQQHSEDTTHDIGISRLPPVTINPPKRDLADWGYWAFSGLLVVVGGLQVWLLLGTLRSLQHQTVLMERQINKERARIRIELKDFRPEYPDDGEDETVQQVAYKVTFYGSAYAFIDEESFEVELADSPNAKTDELGSSLQIGQLPEVVSPNTPPTERIEPFATTRFEVDSLLHGKSFIHFRGRIKYHDFSEIIRETSVYYVWKSWGPKKGRSILGGSGRWVKSGPPDSNHET